VSDSQARPTVLSCGGVHDPADTVAFERLPGRPVTLTTRLAPSPDDPRLGLSVRRFLPTKGRRMVGAWCFVDHFGPDDVSSTEGMLLAPHPHIGLQTVTWLLEGEVLHLDSLGSRQPIRPGQLNLMTAGDGISHAEESPRPRPCLLHGLQLWVALPERSRRDPASFEHYEELPVLPLPGMSAVVLLGTLAGVTSPATTHTPLVGAVVDVQAGAGLDGYTAWLPLQRLFEYAVLVIEGEVSLDGQPLDDSELVYLGHGRDGVELRSGPGARFLLLGGEPFREEILMWWNFIGRSHEEIVSARALWSAHAPRFGRVEGARSPRLPAPPMPARALRSRGRR